MQLEVAVEIQKAYSKLTSGQVPFTKKKRLLEKAPTVDAVPVVHGRWIYEEETLFTLSGYRCSVCRRPRWLSPDVPEAFKYCPNCGAKMDGGVDLEEIENGMCRIKERRSIWQNSRIYALCQAVRLRLIDKIKEKRR